MSNQLRKMARSKHVYAQREAIREAGLRFSGMGRERRRSIDSLMELARARALEKASMSRQQEKDTEDEASD